MLDQNVAREVLQEAVRTGGDFAEIFMEDRIDHAMGMRSHKLESATTSRTHGAGVRVFSGTNAIYVYTNDTSREGLMNCARQAAAAVRGGKGCVVAPFKPWDASRPEEILLLPTDVKAALKAEKLRAAEAAARSISPEIVQVMANYGDHVQDVCICNTEGVFVTDRRVQTRLRVSAIASNGTENQSGSDAPGASMGFELFDTRVNAEESGKIAAQQAVTMLHAPVCPAGVMPVAIDNGFGGVIFHEACGHSLEATSVGIGVSEFCGKLGQQIASPIVTAISAGPRYRQHCSLTAPSAVTENGSSPLSLRSGWTNAFICTVSSPRRTSTLMPQRANASLNSSFIFAPRKSRMRHPSYRVASAPTPARAAHQSACRSRPRSALSPSGHLRAGRIAPPRPLSRFPAPQPTKMPPRRQTRLRTPPWKRRLSAAARASLSSYQ